LALDTGGPAPEHGDQFAGLVGDLDIVYATAAALVAGMALRGEQIAQMGRGQEVDVDPGRHGTMVEAVAGIGEGGVGDGEDKAAVAGAVAIHHVLAYGHRQRGRPWADRYDGHAEPTSGMVVWPHDVGAASGNLFRSQHLERKRNYPISFALQHIIRYYRNLWRDPTKEKYLMKIHEYQGKEILRKFGVATPRGIPCFSVDEAVKAAETLGGNIWVVKAQIHAGGRGKGGGVKLARTLDEVRANATAILGMQLKTHQTGPEGQKVRRLLIEDGADIKKEYYVAALTDRATQKVAMMASSEGGMDIEEVARKTPEKIIKVFVDPLVGLTDAQAKELVDGIGVPAASQTQAIDTLKKLYTCYMETDASLAEINPLILEGNGNIKALDAKFNFDANALYRQPEIVAYRDLDEEDADEIEASKFDLAYISLDGNIGCLVNGAGLAMATMDTIKLFGAEPANFLDVGGGATTEKVTEAFKIMLKNTKVKGILVNIFGGIMKCDTIATGVVTAAKETHLSVPLVVRMKGTNEDLGKKILAESGLPIIAADTMAEAATKIVAAVK
jgi:succinyl-CoA synthetase beta subunit